MKQTTALLLPGLSEEAILRWMVLFLSFLIGGVAGLCAVIIAQTLMGFSKKFGRGDTSRFGGAVIVSFFCLSHLWMVGQVGLITLSVTSQAMIALGLSAYCYGLFQEMFGRQSLKLAFIILVVLFSALLPLYPNLILEHTGFAIIDGIFSIHSIVPFVCTVMILAYSVFAFDTANGANGLVSLLSVFGIVGLIQSGFTNIDGLSSVLSLVAVGCVIFLLFNMTIGRVFIGVGGTYFLGVVLGIAFIGLINFQRIDPAYVLCLFFYPNANLLFSVVRRILAGRAVFGGDNGHLHNLLYRRLAGVAWLKNLANTIAGVLIAFVFAGLPVLLANIFTDVNWWLIYAVQWLVYSGCWVMLRDSATEEKFLRDVDLKS